MIMARRWTDDEKARACEEILAQVAKGRSLRDVCDNGDDWIPPRKTFEGWCDADADLAAQYAQAREDRADVIFDEILEIADDATNDWMERNGDNAKGWVENGEHIQRSRLRVDARKWMVGKMNPKKYGDKLDVNHGGAIAVTGVEVAFVRPVDKT